MAKKEKWCGNKIFLTFVYSSCFYSKLKSLKKCNNETK